MAMSLLFLLAMIIGIIEFGWLVRNNLIIANASREGARVAAVGRTSAATRSRITNSAGSLSVASPTGSVTLEQSIDNGATWTAWASDTGSTKNLIPTGALLRVRVRSNHRQLTGFFPFLSNRVIEQFTTMRREQ
jgi:Flp pilus assembly protein TadG